MWSSHEDTDTLSECFTWTFTLTGAMSTFIILTSSSLLSPSRHCSPHFIRLTGVAHWKCIWTHNLSLSIWFVNLCFHASLRKCFISEKNVQKAASFSESLGAIWWATFRTAGPQSPHLTYKHDACVWSSILVRVHVFILLSGRIQVRV